MERVSTFMSCFLKYNTDWKLHAAPQQTADHVGRYQAPASLSLSLTLSFPLAYYKPLNISQDEKKGEKASLL